MGEGGQCGPPGRATQPSPTPTEPRSGAGSSGRQGLPSRLLTHHGKAGEQSRSAAGGFQFGPAEIKPPPIQGVQRVLVGAHQLQVTSPDELAVSGGDAQRLRRLGVQRLPFPFCAFALRRLGSPSGFHWSCRERQAGGLLASTEGRQAGARPPLPAGPNKQDTG